MVITYSNAIVFSAAYVWPGMQTGNTAQVSDRRSHTQLNTYLFLSQLGVALGRLFENGGADLRFHLADRFALCCPSPSVPSQPASVTASALPPGHGSLPAHSFRQS
jgi:hypothetical protein